MEIIKNNNTVSFNGKEIFFQYNVETILVFPQYCVVLLMSDNIPDNNVEAVDYNGNKVWNISQIVRLTYPEAYISLAKESETSFSVVSYNGVKFVIDIETKEIIYQSITK